MNEDEKVQDQSKLEEKSKLDLLLEDRPKQLSEKDQMNLRVSYAVLFAWIPIGFLLGGKLLLMIIDGNSNFASLLVFELVVLVAVTIFGIIFNIKRIKRINRKKI